MRPARQRRRGKAARNEERKLLATTVNAVGLAVFAVGALPRLTTPPYVGRDVVALIVYGLILIGLHIAARRFLRALED
jgi:hypothetical protein